MEKEPTLTSLFLSGKNIYISYFIKKISKEGAPVLFRAAISPNTWRAGGQARKAPLPHQRGGGGRKAKLWNGMEDESFLGIGSIYQCRGNVNPEVREKEGGGRAAAPPL